MQVWLLDIRYTCGCCGWPLHVCAVVAVVGLQPRLGPPWPCRGWRLAGRYAVHSTQPSPARAEQQLSKSWHLYLATAGTGLGWGLATRGTTGSAQRTPAAATRTLTRGHRDKWQYCSVRTWNEGYPKLREDFTITEKAPTRVVSWLKASTSISTFKTLLTHLQLHIPCYNCVTILHLHTVGSMSI